jgi:WD40 repeat protein
MTSSTPNENSPADLTDAYTPRPEASETPLVIPGYELLGLLGRGGMGAVYQARQLRLNRIVAVKMLLAGTNAGPQELFRFRLETEAVGRLQHPNIVQIFEVGEVEGRPFCVLEFVQGGSLAGRLKAGALPPGDAAALVETLAEAIQVAHDHGIIHRDLKPANVLLAGGPAGLVPKIADFGLAKHLDTDSGQTRTGAIVGTPAYMAPEQAAGQTALIGPAADIYALGAVLYECLTGRRAFAADSVMEVLRKVREQEPPLPRKIVPRLPLDLEIICLKCLRKEAGQRYASARALAEDLRRFRQGEPILARPVGPMGRAWAWARRRPALAASYLLTVLALVLGAGAIGAVWLWREAEEARRQAEDAQKGEARANDTLDQVLYLQRVQLAHREWLSSNVSRCLELLDDCPELRRGWEWRYVRRLPRPLLEFGGRSKDGSPLAGECVALSPDGRRIASGSTINGLRVWDAETGREMAVLEGSAPLRGPGGAFGLASGPPCRGVFSPDGQRVIGGTAVRPLGQWDATTGKLLPGVVQVPFRPYCLALHPDGQRLAIGCGGGNVHVTVVAVLDLHRGEAPLRLTGHHAPVSALAYSRDGTRLASGAEDGEVILWNVATSKPVLTLPRLPVRITAVAFSPCGVRVAAAAGDGLVKVWQVADGKELLIVNNSGNSANALAFIDDERLAIGLATGEVSVWQVATRQKDFALRGHRGPMPQIKGLAASSDRRRLLSAGADGMLKVWDATNPEYRSTTTDNIFQMTAAFSPATSRLLLARTDGVAELWDLAGPRRLWQRRISPETLEAAALSPDGQRLAVGGQDRIVRVCDVEGKEVLALSGHTQMVRSLAFSPDGRSLAGSVGDPGVETELKLWDLANPGTSVRLASGQPTILSLAFRPDGRHLAAGGQDGSVAAWDVGSAREVWRRPASRGWATSLAYRADGKMLAVGSTDGTVAVMNADTGEQVLLLRGEGGQVQSVAFSPDGRRLAVGAGHVTLWDLSTGQPALTLPGTMSLAFSADGSRLIGCDRNGNLRIWDGSPLPEGQ